MSELAIPMATLPATPAPVLEKIRGLERWLTEQGSDEVLTWHLIHAGMYARTIAMPRDMVLTGALMKRPTVVIVYGSALVQAGEEWIKLDGYNVIPASAGRKQVFIARSLVFITMTFPTAAKTVEEAEAEMTDEAELLLSRRQDSNRVVITEE